MVTRGERLADELIRVLSDCPWLRALDIDKLRVEAIWTGDKPKVLITPTVKK